MKGSCTGLQTLWSAAKESKVVIIMENATYKYNGSQPDKDRLQAEVHKLQINDGSVLTNAVLAPAKASAGAFPVKINFKQSVVALDTLAVDRASVSLLERILCKLDLHVWPYQGNDNPLTLYNVDTDIFWHYSPEPGGVSSRGQHFPICRLKGRPSPLNVVELLWTLHI